MVLNKNKIASVVVVVVSLLAAGVGLLVEAAPAPKGRSAVVGKYKSPACIAFSPDGRLGYVTQHTADSLGVIDTASAKLVGEIPVGGGPWGVAVSPNGKLLFVANQRDHTVSFIDAVRRKVVATVKCGYEPTGLAISPDGKTLYSANYISNDVSVISVSGRKEVARIKTGRAPMYLALTPDGRKLLVNNSLSPQPATDPNVTAWVSVIDTASRKVIAQKRSPGTMLLGRGIAITPDGKTAFCVHSRPNFTITTAQIGQGWIHTNALTMIPLEGDGAVRTVLLDNVNSGAANPHGVAISKDAGRLFVSHRGIHKVSVIDLKRLRYILKTMPPEKLKTAHINLVLLWRNGRTIGRSEVGGRGPTGIAICPSDKKLYTANYYSDSVSVLDGVTGKLVKTISLGGPKEMDVVRRGEFLFHDATQCFQNWLSCVSCHPRTRADGVNWDLLNDGITNPKNAKSLVGSWRTPPSMALGVRSSMEVAAEKGFRFIQFIQPTDDVLKCVRAYLRDVKHIPSPYHRKADGSLDASAMRGKKLFAQAGCADCHPAPLYTDLQMYDVGTRNARNIKGRKEFDTPSLIELYRTGPYLHDGRAATLGDVIGKFNVKNQHGETSRLTPVQKADLVAFLMSL
ncbi:MAG: beta-propeller fold lactonase family protein [Phycisphaerales bacterium]|nr:beta-propeller fold lactonase family protein [Phycisphaerales bacterium]